MDEGNMNFTEIESTSMTETKKEVPKPKFVFNRLKS
jgi:hypothetical protein